MTRMEEDGTIYHVAGDTFKLNLIDLFDDANQPINWTGWKQSFRIKEKENSNNFLIELTESSGINLGIPGAVNMEIEATATKLTKKVYYYDWILTDPGNNVETYLHNKKFIIE